jgi:hypothetical protein
MSSTSATTRKIQKDHGVYLRTVTRAKRFLEPR